MIETNIAVSYRVQLLRAGGVVETREGKNLITDTGLSALGEGTVGATPYSADPFAYLAAGTGVSPVKRASGGITFTVSGTAPNYTLTASAGFFTASDNGRILKTSSGTEYRLGVFTSGTVIAASLVSGTVASGLTGSVHYVNENALSAPSAITGSFTVVSTLFDTATATLASRYLADSILATGPITITELGWSMNQVNLTGRTLLVSPIAMQAGDSLRVTLDVSLALSPSTVALPTGIFAGTSKLVGHADVAQNFGRSGSIYLHDSPFSFSAVTKTPASQSAGYFGDGGTTIRVETSLGVHEYTGNFTKDYANGTIAGVSFGAFGHNLTTPVVKTNTQALSITWQVKFTRNLVN